MDISEETSKNKEVQRFISDLLPVLRMNEARLFKKKNINNSSQMVEEVEATAEIWISLLVSNLHSKLFHHNIKNSKRLVEGQVSEISLLIMS